VAELGEQARQEAQQDAVAEPRLPTNWKVKAVDMTAADLRAGVNLPPGWEPFAVVLRSSVPAVIIKMEVS
jgi:hypothetical protein